MIVDVAIRSTLKRSGRVPPRGWVRICTSSAVGNVVTAEKPDIDGGASPFHSIYTAFGSIETISIGGWTALLDSTTSMSLAIFVDHGAASTRVQRHCVGRLVVDAFDDVDLTVTRPIGSGHPESRPDTARRSRHMLEIEHNKSMCIFLVAREPDTIAAAAGGDVGGI